MHSGLADNHMRKGRLSIVVSQPRDAQRFEQEGVDLVLVPCADAAREAAIRVMAKGRVRLAGHPEVTLAPGLVTRGNVGVAGH